jgi:hypothetical protein
MSQRNSKAGIARSETGRAEVMDAVSSLAEQVARLTLHVNQFKKASGSTACDAPATDTAPATDPTEASSVPLSPEQDSLTRDVSVDVRDTKTGATRSRPKAARSRGENAIAGRVLELHDRLGGFIKPSSP